MSLISFSNVNSWVTLILDLPSIYYPLLPFNPLSTLLHSTPLYSPLHQSTPLYSPLLPSTPLHITLLLSITRYTPTILLSLLPSQLLFLIHVLSLILLSSWFSLISPYFLRILPANLYYLNPSQSILFKPRLIYPFKNPSQSILFKPQPIYPF